MSLQELEQRMEEFCRMFCKRGTKPSLRMIGVMAWTLGFELDFRLPPRPRKMVEGDIFS